MMRFAAGPFTASGKRLPRHAAHQLSTRLRRSTQRLISPKRGSTRKLSIFFCTKTIIYSMLNCYELPTEQPWIKTIPTKREGTGYTHWQRRIDNCDVAQNEYNDMHVVSRVNYYIVVDILHSNVLDWCLCIIAVWRRNRLCVLLGLHQFILEVLHCISTRVSNTCYTPPAVKITINILQPAL